MDKPPKIGVYGKWDSLGTSTLRFPFVIALRDRFPDAHITWISRGTTHYASLLREEAGHYLNRTIENADMGTRLGDYIGPVTHDIPHLDILIDIQSVFFRTLCLSWRTSHGLFVSDTARHLFSDRRPVNRLERSRHIVRRCLDLLDLVKPGPHPDGGVFKTTTLNSLAEHLLKVMENDRSYIGFAPGAGSPLKRWPLDRFITLARETVTRGDIPVFFIGPAERDLMPVIADALPEARFPEYEARQTVPEVATPLLVSALAKRLTAAVGNDSGVGHLIAAGGTPMVQLFSVHPAERYAPYTTRVRALDSRSYGGETPDLIPLNDVRTALAGLTEAPTGPGMPRRHSNTALQRPDQFL